MYDISTAEKGKRMVYLYKLFINGNKLSSKEITDIMREEFSDLSIRTIQRDIKDLCEVEPAIMRIREGKNSYWKIDRRASMVKQTFRITPSELLSFHILKAHLKSFDKTVIAEEVNLLAKKLEEYAPNEVYSKESLFWDQNIGRYDYTQLDPIIRRIIKYITDETSALVEYYSNDSRKIKKYLVTLRKIFSYAGMLYVVAYVPRHDSHIALSIQNINKIDERKNYKYALPEFDFKKWTKNRFGVFYGPSRKVVLHIDKDYSHYFENRIWHQSQQITKQDDGSLILEMNVPLAPDFKAWILGWADAVTILKPKDLIEEIHKKVKNILNKYE
jgi:predicted DNA-binding transcriptional regulator YafY